MKKTIYCLLLLFLCVSFCEAGEQLEIIDKGKVALDTFVAGTVEAHDKIEQNQYDSTRISSRVDIKGSIYLKGDGATPLNYTEILRLDSDGIVYCIITLWHTPFRTKSGRIQITRTIINNSNTEYEFPDWTGLKVEWFLIK